VHEASTLIYGAHGVMTRRAHTRIPIRSVPASERASVRASAHARARDLSHRRYRARGSPRSAAFGNLRAGIINRNHHRAINARSRSERAVLISASIHPSPPPVRANRRAPSISSVERSEARRVSRLNEALAALQVAEARSPYGGGIHRGGTATFRAASSILERSSTESLRERGVKYGPIKGHPDESVRSLFDRGPGRGGGWYPAMCRAAVIVDEKRRGFFRAITVTLDRKVNRATTLLRGQPADPRAI